MLERELIDGDEFRALIGKAPKKVEAPREAPPKEIPQGEERKEVPQAESNMWADMGL